MQYTTLLFDLDHTLFDSDVAEAAAFDDTLQSAGADPTEDYYETFADINTDLWAKVEQGVLTPNEVRHLRFRLLIDATDLAADPVEMGDRYVWGLGNNGDLYPGAREVIESLTGTATLALITNGIGEVQRRRARLERDADHTRDRRSRRAHGDYLRLSRDRKREMMTEEVSQVHSIESATMTGRKHPVTTAFAWIFGAVAVLLSMFWVFLVVTIVSEWSSYVGHESSTATTIVAVFGIFTLGAWALAAAIFVAARRG